MKPWLIYGANGYTGELIAREAVKRGFSPILAGRNRVAVEALGRDLGLETRIFACESVSEIAAGLHGVHSVLHCAGPFSATSVPMVEACVKVRANYLDITGEIPVFERIHRASERFREAGIIAMPGVGFDVVPSDCLAAMLKSELPEATRLVMALRMGATPSPGTSKTLVEGLHAGAVVRKNGKLVRLPPGAQVRKIRFAADQDEVPCVLFPWGDVSTAYYSTGIQDIEFYAALSPSVTAGIRLSRWFSPVLALKPVQSLLKKGVERWIRGPVGEVRSESPYYLWGRATAPSGRSVEKRIKTPNGYDLTVDSSILAIQRVDEGGVLPGAWTPSRAFGQDFVARLKGVSIA